MNSSTLYTSCHLNQHSRQHSVYKSTNHLDLFQGQDTGNVNFNNLLSCYHECWCQGLIQDISISVEDQSLISRDLRLTGETGGAAVRMGCDGQGSGCHRTGDRRRVRSDPLDRIGSRDGQ